MTAFDRSDSIQLGDWVIIFHVRLALVSLSPLSSPSSSSSSSSVLTLDLPQSRTQLTSEIVTRDRDIQSRYGYFRHNDFVGKPWGTKLASGNGRGFVYLLKPTPELWQVRLSAPLVN